MKYIKFFENSDWKLSPEQKQELVDKYTKISKKIEIEITKHIINITAITIKDVYDDVKRYKQLLNNLELQKKSINKIIDEVWNLVDRYESDIVMGDFQKIHDKLDYNLMELDEVMELLDSFINFVENLENKELLSKVLKGNSDYQINI